MCKLIQSDGRAEVGQLGLSAAPTLYADISDVVPIKVSNILRQTVGYGRDICVCVRKTEE